MVRPEGEEGTGQRKIAVDAVFNTVGVATTFQKELGDAPEVHRDCLVQEQRRLPVTALPDFQLPRHGGRNRGPVGAGVNVQILLRRTRAVSKLDVGGPLVSSLGRE